MSEWEAFVAVAAGALATGLWRVAGVALAGRIDPNGAAVRWFACITYALIGGLVARMILLPLGPLAATPLWARLAAAAIAMAVFFLGGRTLLGGVVAGGVVLAGFVAVG